MTTPTPQQVYGVAVGTLATTPFLTVIRSRSPNSSDLENFQLGQRWVNSVSHGEYFLLNFTTVGGFLQANWVLLNSGSGTLNELKDNLGNIVLPDIMGAINVVGNPATGVTTDGTISPNTLTLQLGSIPNSSLANSSVSVTSTNGSLSITGGSPLSLGGVVNIAVAGGGIGWVDVMVGAQLIAANTGYVVDNGAGLVTFTLPAIATIGDTYIIQGKSIGGWQVNVGAGQVINVGSMPTGMGGNVASTNQWDSITITCVTANTTFAVRAVQGNLNVV